MKTSQNIAQKLNKVWKPLPPIGDEGCIESDLVTPIVISVCTDLRVTIAIEDGCWLDVTPTQARDIALALQKAASYCDDLTQGVSELSRALREQHKGPYNHPSLDN